MTTGAVSTFSLKEIKKGLHREELLKCVTEMGIFYLSDYGFDDTRHRVATDIGLDFFRNSSDEEKQSVSNKNKSIRRGFSELEAESTAIVTNNGSYSDYSMCYSMGLSGNMFPSAQFEAIWSDYFSDLYTVAQDAAGAVMRAVGVFAGDEDKLNEFLDCDPVLRLRYFPEVPEDRMAEITPMRMAPHYDLSIITLIQQFACPNGFVSLQAHYPWGTIDLPEVPKTILVLCGAVAKIVSKGKIPSPIHQVASPSGQQIIGSERTSSVFFLRPKAGFSFSVPDARDCGLDICISKEFATFGEWIGANYIELGAHKDEALLES